MSDPAPEAIYPASGKKPAKGEKIEVLLPYDLDLFFIEPQGGPWGCNCHTSAWIEEKAVQVTRAGDDRIIFRRRS